MAGRRMLTEKALFAKMKERCQFFVPNIEYETIIIEMQVNGEGSPVEQGFHVFGDIKNFDPSYQYYFNHIAAVLGEFRLEMNSLYQFQILSSKLKFVTVKVNFIGEVSETSVGYVRLANRNTEICVETHQSNLVIGTPCTVGQDPFLLITNPPEPQPFYPSFPIAKVSEPPGISPLPSAQSWEYPIPQETQPQSDYSSYQYPADQYYEPIQADPQYGYSDGQQVSQFQEAQPPHTPLLDEDCDVSQIDVETYPQTSGEKRLPIKSLANCSKWNQQQSANALSLAQKFTHWRRSRGDGNCYFRAVSVGYLEHLCRLSTSPIVFKEFYDKLWRQENVTILSDFIQYSKIFMRYMKELYCFKRENCALQKLQELLQLPEFDLSAVAMFRCIALHSLYLLKDHPDFMPFLFDSSVDTIADQIGTMGHEAEGVTFLVMANALDAKIVHTTLSPTACREDSFKPFNPGRKIVLHILLKPGHYDTLYSVAAQKMDQYSFVSNAFNENPSPEDANGLYEDISGH